MTAALGEGEIIAHATAWVAGKKPRAAATAKDWLAGVSWHPCIHHRGTENTEGMRRKANFVVLKNCFLRIPSVFSVPLW
jgi:hypothetical protein